MSHPTMGAWIEILVCIALLTLANTSHPTMGAWIEIKLEAERYAQLKSHPTMGAWIEILLNLFLLLLSDLSRTPRWVRGLK